MAFETELMVLGRILLGGYFAFAGVNHFMKDGQMSGWIESKGLPVPDALNYFAGGLLLLAGLDVVFGTYPIVAWGALSLFTLTVSFLFHDFWNMEDEEKQSHMTNFMKNFALLGGLMLFAAMASQGSIGPVAAELTLR
jgi:putative oxidoreductase